MGQIAYAFRVEMSIALYESYLKILSSGECETQYEAIEKARKSPAPSFFTSSRNCAEVLAKLDRGEPTGLKDPDKVRKFNELHARSMRYRQECDCYPGIMQMSRDLVRQDAPEYYICHNTAKQIILRERRKRQEEAMRWVKR